MSARPPRQIANPEMYAYYASPHPRDFVCPSCGAKEGQYCRSKNGKLIIKFEKIHVGRKRVFDEALQRQVEALETYVES
jgi:hypothetical protein